MGSLDVSGWGPLKSRDERETEELEATNRQEGEISNGEVHEGGAGQAEYHDQGGQGSTLGGKSNVYDPSEGLPRALENTVWGRITLE